MQEIIAAGVIFMLGASAVAAIWAPELISAVFLLGCYSFFHAILWSILNAPDVAFTEAMVGVGAGTIFFLLALFQTRHTATKPVLNRSWPLSLGVVILFIGMVLYCSVDLPAFGSASSWPNSYLSPYYILNTFSDMHTPNAVTAVVTDYRSFDTLIEATVIFTAGLSCLLIMKVKI